MGRKFRSYETQPDYFDDDAADAAYEDAQEQERIQKEDNPEPDKEEETDLPEGF